MFIVFEGIDNSGKSTLSKKFVEYLSLPKTKELVSKFHSDSDDQWVAMAGDFSWTKEPQFTTEEADMLNSPEFKDEHKREAFFFADRFKHQAELSQGFKVCDRYVWTGLAYTQKFSPNCYPIVKHLYTNDQIFIQPDLYIFVDTPLEICDQRDPEVGLDRLTSLRQAYIDNTSLAAKPEDIIYTSAEGDVEESLKLVIGKFESWLEGKRA
jgi:thymidylate kinase